VVRRTQAPIAVPADSEHRLLCNAAPDLRAQILDTPALRPKGGLRQKMPRPVGVARYQRAKSCGSVP